MGPKSKKNPKIHREADQDDKMISDKIKATMINHDDDDDKSWPLNERGWNAGQVKPPCRRVASVVQIFLKTNS